MQRNSSLGRGPQGGHSRTTAWGKRRKLPKSNRKLRTLRERLAWVRHVPAAVLRSVWRQKRFLFAGMLATGLATGAWFVYRFATTSSYFAIGSISIRGNTHTSREEILAALPFSYGTNIFKASMASGEQGIAKLAWVESANVEQRLPDQVEISIVERQATGVVALGDLYMVDRKGIPFRRVVLGSDDIANLAVVTGITRSAYNANTQEAQTDILRALDLLTVWNGVPSRPKASHVNVDHGSFSVLVDGGEQQPPIAIYLAEPANLERKLATFDHAWASFSDADKRSLTELRLDYQPDQLIASFVP